MSLYIGDTLIAGSINGQQLNNPFSLLDYKWSEYELNNASWLLSNGAFHSGATYVAVYELLLKIHNGTVTKAGVSVKLSTEAYADTDFVLNTSDTTFRLPLKVALASGKAVVGNGKTLGLQNATISGGLGANTSTGIISAFTDYYGTDKGTTGAIATNFITGSLGVTTDSEKSGIETSANGLYLYFYVGETVQDANIIAATGVLTDVANLKAHYITETYVNGTSWYRVYSDGWCEQGGQIIGTTSGTLTFLKPYQDTNYTIFMHGVGTYTGNVTGNGLFNPKTRTASSCTYYQDGNVNTMMWQACGYTA